MPIKDQGDTLTKAIKDMAEKVDDRTKTDGKSRGHAGFEDLLLAVLSGTALAPEETMSAASTTPVFSGWGVAHPKPLPTPLTIPSPKSPTPSNNSPRSSISPKTRLLLSFTPGRLAFLTGNKQQRRFSRKTLNTSDVCDNNGDNLLSLHPGDGEKKQQRS